MLGKLGLSFDHCGMHTQILALAKLARRFPSVSIVCDHCGCPTMVGPYAGQGPDIFARWQ